MDFRIQNPKIVTTYLNNPGSTNGIAISYNQDYKNNNLYIIEFKLERMCNPRVITLTDMSSRIVTTTGMNKLNVLISHSISLKTSIVQVLVEGQMSLVAHLVGKETIGDQIHLGLQFVSLLLKMLTFTIREVLRLFDFYANLVILK